MRPFRVTVLKPEGDPPRRDEVCPFGYRCTEEEVHGDETRHYCDQLPLGSTWRSR
jgi:hypothetical protein